MAFRCVVDFLTSAPVKAHLAVLSCAYSQLLLPLPLPPLPATLPYLTLRRSCRATTAAPWYKLPVYPNSHCYFKLPASCLSSRPCHRHRPCSLLTSALHCYISVRLAFFRRCFYLSSVPAVGQLPFVPLLQCACSHRKIMHDILLTMEAISPKSYIVVAFSTPFRPTSRPFCLPRPHF